MPKFELPDAVTNIVENATEELSTNIGKTFGDIWFFVFGGISQAADKRRAKYAHDLTVYKQKLSASIAKIPEDKQTEPSLQITAQALENSKYCVSEKELCDMFVSLISNSMNKDYINDIHPSFAEIIKQMSVLDAKIINLLKPKALPGLPICKYGVKIPGTVTQTPIPEHIFLETDDGDIHARSISLCSLARFGLISISYTQWLTDQNLYNKFSIFPLYEDLKKMWPGEPTISKGMILLTPLGRSFINLCIPD